MTKDDLKEMISAANEAQEDVFLTVEQAARQLGCSPQTLRNWEAEGKFLPTSKTEKGHRRYSRKAISEYKRKLNDFELLVRMKPDRLMSGMQNLLSIFPPDQEICVTIRSDKLNRSVHFTFDSEDGLQTITKTMKMEE